MSDEQQPAPQLDEEIEDVMADDCEMPVVGDYVLSTRRPGVVSGGS
jgi:hypothetical protein